MYNTNQEKISEEIKSPTNPCDSDGRESACNAEDLGLIPVLRRSPGGRHGNPLQYSCLESSMRRGAWRAIAPGFAESWTQLSD